MTGSTGNEPRPLRAALQRPERRRGEPAEVHRRERAGCEESGRVGGRVARLSDYHFRLILRDAYPCTVSRHAESIIKPNAGRPKSRGCADVERD